MFQKCWYAKSNPPGGCGFTSGSQHVLGGLRSGFIVEMLRVVPETTKRRDQYTTHYYK